MQRRIQVLLVMSRRHQRQVLVHLKGQGFEVLVAGSCREAERILKVNPQIAVILTDRSLTDGTWRDVLEVVSQKGLPARIVVCCRQEETIAAWQDILDAGAHDILTEPYEGDDIRWMVESAAG